jgi:hypothetical protein
MFTIYNEKIDWANAISSRLINISYSSTYANIVVGELFSPNNMSQTEMESINSELINSFIGLNMGHREYQIMLSRVDRLSDDIETSDEYDGASIPENQAIDKAKSILNSLYLTMNKNFFKGAVTTSYEGGIRIQWIRPNANVRLIIHPKDDSKGYIYFEENGQYGTNSFDIKFLIQKLNDLIVANYDFH